MAGAPASARRRSRRCSGPSISRQRQNDLVGRDGPADVRGEARNARAQNRLRAPAGGNTSCWASPAARAPSMPRRTIKVAPSALMKCMPFEEGRATAAIASASPADWKMRITSPSKCTARGRDVDRRSRSYTSDATAGRPSRLASSAPTGPKPTMATSYFVLSGYSRRTRRFYLVRTSISSLEAVAEMVAAEWLNPTWFVPPWSKPGMCPEGAEGHRPTVALSL